MIITDTVLNNHAVHVRQRQEAVCIVRVYGRSVFIIQIQARFEFDSSIVSQQGNERAVEWT